MTLLASLRKVSREYSVFFGAILVPSILGLGLLKITQLFQTRNSLGCEQLYQIDLSPDTSQALPKGLESSVTCYQFEAQSGQNLGIKTNRTISLIFPNTQTVEIQDVWGQVLTHSGQYYIKVEPNTFLADDFSVDLSTWSADDNILFESAIDSTTRERIENPNNLEFNSLSPLRNDSFVRDPELSIILERVIAQVEQRGLPLDKLSISLVDLTLETCCGYAGFNDRYPRYPASVVKLFWLVNLYAQYQTGDLSSNIISEREIYEMIADSDNEPASRVLDLITQTESGGNLSSTDLDQWMNKRFSVNRYFEIRGYQGINISQKTFPIPYLQLNEPQGRELQMRGDAAQPIRNFLTTHSTARLLHEIFIGHALNPVNNQRVLGHLKRDLLPSSWQGRPFNSIEGFLGQSLPSNTTFYSKAGWMSISRNDAAIIITPDGKTQYILVVFGDDKAFMDDDDIFPIISRTIYQGLVDNP